MVVLAAGQGKRMHSRLPKVLQPIAAQPMLAHVLATARQLKPEALVVVYGHGADAVRAQFTENDLRWAFQEEQKGTGHALLQALNHLSAQESKVLVLYGDVPLLQPATLQRMLSHPAERLVLLTQTVQNPKGYGRILRNDAGSIVGIREEKDADDREKEILEVNTGIMLMPGQRLRGWLSRLNCDNAQGEYYLTDVVALAVGDGVTVESEEPGYPWEALGVNDKVQLAQLERIHQACEAEKLMKEGVTIIDPERLTLRGKVSCGRDVTLDVGVILEGTVVLEDGVSVGAYSIVRNSRLGCGAEVHPYSMIDGSVVGQDNRIGPYARLRPGTETGHSVHVGNYVEIKNSSMGEQSKANHLSYIGDSTVGCRVNIGAGTITCNYDGVNKHRTVIGNDVFIGSDTQLIAPVTVEDGATIGAGSTIVTTAPAHQLTLSRVRQTSIPAWRRPRKIDKPKS